MRTLGDKLSFCVIKPLEQRGNVFGVNPHKNLGFLLSKPFDQHVFFFFGKIFEDRVYQEILHTTIIKEYMWP